MGYQGGLDSAAGGYDIPGSLNPLTQLHAREIELPADIAEPLRAQVRDGGLGGATVVANFRGASTRDFFLASKSELAEAIRAAYRDGHRLKV